MGAGGVIAVPAAMGLGGGLDQAKKGWVRVGKRRLKGTIKWERRGKSGAAGDDLSR